MLNGQKSIVVCLVVTISVKQKSSFNESPKNMINFNHGVLSFLFFFLVNLQETMTGEKKSLNKTTTAEEVNK